MIGGRVQASSACAAESGAPAGSVCLLSPSPIGSKRAYTRGMLHPVSDAALPRNIAEAALDAVTVRHLRQVLLWPLRLIRAREASADDGPRRTPWQILRELGNTSPWREAVDEYTGDKSSFHERHYNEFVTFLPYVQRFLYGESRSRRGAAGEHGSDSPIDRKSVV